MQVGDELFNKSEINRLYYPLSELSTAPMRPVETGVSTRVTVRILLSDGRKLGATEIALLEAVAAQGSITGAARSLGVSYRFAWVSLQSINSMLCRPAVATTIGGSTKGGAALTPTGTEVLALYRAIQKHAQSAAHSELEAFGAIARATRIKKSLLD
jgi:molybdate transport system regulatory protein